MWIRRCDPEHQRRAAIFDRPGLELGAGQHQLFDLRRHADGGIDVRRCVFGASQRRRRDHRANHVANDDETRRQVRHASQRAPRPSRLRCLKNWRTLRDVRLVSLDQKVVDAGLLELFFDLRRVRAAEPAADDERTARLRLAGPDKADAVESVLGRVAQLQHSAIVLLSQPLQGRDGPGIMQVGEDDHQHAVSETRGQLDQPCPQRRRLVVAKRPQAVQPLEHLVSRQAGAHVQAAARPRPEAPPG